MTTMKIIGIEKDAARGMISVLKELTEDDGTVHINQHFFPDDAVEWKMAEYDTDNQTALDIILHEPFADQTTYRHLYLFDSKAEALAYTKQEIDVIKRRMTPRGPDKPNAVTSLRPGEISTDDYQNILSYCVINDDALELKRNHIDKAFAMKAREKEDDENSNVDRIARLRSTLERSERKFEE